MGESRNDRDPPPKQQNWRFTAAIKRDHHYAPGGSAISVINRTTAIGINIIIPFGNESPHVDPNV